MCGCNAGKLSMFTVLSKFFNVWLDSMIYHTCIQLYDGDIVHHCFSY